MIFIHRFRLVILLVSISFTLLPVLGSAQGDDIVITFALSEMMEDMFGERLVEEFETEHPGIRVKIVNGDGGGLFAGGDVDTYLDDFADYAGEADVLYIHSGGLSPSAALAGYLLDLTPLVRADSDLDEANFYPAAWQSVQWDGGTWAVPFGVDPVVLFYDVEAFDAAGLAYPTADWSIHELTNAIRVLTRFNADGTVEREALQVFRGQLNMVFRSLLGRNLYDSTTVPNPPNLNDTELEEILATWGQLQADGYLSQNNNMIVYSSEDVQPLQISPASLGLMENEFGRSNQRLVPTLLPGGHAGIIIEGVAISSGTQYPEAAYTFASFLSRSATTTNSFMNIRPARQSMAGVNELSPEDETFVETALQRAISSSDMRYTEYLTVALEKMQQNNLSAATALEEAGMQALNDIELAVERSDDAIIVAAPPADVDLGAGEIVLNFGMSMPMPSLPNQADWERVIEEFVAQHPTVTQINLETDLELSVKPMAEKYDCFYLPYNPVSGGELEHVLALDPLMDSDPTFDKNDLLPGILTQIQQQNRIWAFPINIHPQVLKYNAELFAQIGIPSPDNGWTSDEFVNALYTLYAHNPDQIPFVPHNLGGTSLQMLIVSFGGLPFDYRTNPPTVDFTDPATVDAIRQTLNLAKTGLIAYRNLAAGGDVTAILIRPGGYQPPIFNAALDAFSAMNGTLGNESGSSTHRVTTYPVGSQFSPVGYEVGTAFISENAQDPEACYDWFNAISSHPELLFGMPARHSHIDVLAASQNPDVVAFYRQIEMILQSPDTVTFPSSFISGEFWTRFLLENWLYRVWDNYVNNDVDLESELAQAQQYVDEFQACVSQTSADILDEDADIDQAIIDCATQVDPSLSSLFSR